MTVAKNKRRSRLSPAQKEIPACDAPYHKRQPYSI